MSLAVLAPAPLDSVTTKVAELGKQVSASRLNCFHQCRLKFFFRYVAQIQRPTSGALHVGKIVHAVLQAWNLARWRQQSKTLEDFQGVFEDAWSHPESPVKWKDDESDQKATAWKATETYLRESPIPQDEKPLGVEVRAEMDLVHPGFPKLIGVLDLVRPGGRIVDFKTTAVTPNDERTRHQNELQLTCYGLLYREATGERENGFELHHLVKLKTPKVVVVAADPVTPAQEKRFYRAVESYLEGLERQDFVPSPGMGCLSCEYFGECRKWQGDYQQVEDRRVA